MAVYGSGCNGAVTHGYRQLVERTDDIACREKARNTGAAVRIHHQMADFILFRPQGQGQRRSGTATDCGIEHVDIQDAAVTKLEADAAVRLQARLGNR